MIIKRFDKVILAIIIIITLGGNQMKCYARKDKNISLSVVSINSFGKTEDGFSTEMPVWVMLSLKNEEKKDITIFLNGERDKGIYFKPEQQYKNKIKLLPREVIIETCLIKIVLKPKEQITFEFLINEYVQIVELGDTKFNINMRVYDIDMNPLNLNTTISIKFTHKTDNKEVNFLIDNLDIQFESKSELDRLKALRSAQIIHDVRILSLLSKAIIDKDEEVQLEAVKIISRFKIHKASILLKKALNSDKESVRYLASKELNSRKVVKIKKTNKNT